MHIKQTIFSLNILSIRQGGSVVAGENSLEGAIRELAEESGIVVTKDEIVYKGSIIVPKQHTIYDSYLAQKNFSQSDIILQKGETVDYRIVTFNEIQEMIKSGEFLDFLYYRHRITWGEELDFFANHSKILLERQEKTKIIF